MKTLFFVLLLAISGAAIQANAQDLIPISDSAESVFRTAVQAYEDGEYDVAERLFGVAANNYELHKKTTAALLMQGKSLYQIERYNEAFDVLTLLIDTYPTSRYQEEANSIISMMTNVSDNQDTATDVFRLGIALPLNAEAASFSQHMFNGIHMAVDAYNMSVMSQTTDFPRRPQIQMVFRDTQNNERQAREAIRDLIEVENVDAIIGPLFSTEAIVAAEEAERGQTVLIAPLATAREVSTNKTFVFQANPTLEVRGKLMARFVVRNLNIESVGVLTDYTNSESLGMAKGFERELYELDVEPAFQYYLSGTQSWFRLNDEVSKDSLSKANAIYLPINGGNASTIISGALGSLNRMGLRANLRIIGNKEWHNISGSSLASNYNTTYSNDFFVSEQDSLAQAFQNEYLTTYGVEPIRLSYSGYDVTAFITNQLGTLAAMPEVPLHRILREAGRFNGLGNRIDFSNSNINEAMFFHRYRNGMIDLMQ